MASMDDTVSARKARISERVLEQGLLDAGYPIVGIIDLDAVRGTVNELKASFPAHFVHAFAAKANCMAAVLAFMRGEGLACEVASPGEMAQAAGAGYAPEQIVFDSPAKTGAEIREAIERGIALNIDNFQELDRVDAAMRGCKSTSVLGMRINPQVGAGAIAAVSTATSTSKFGIGLRDGDHRRRIIAAYRQRPWLRAVHTHVGSQGCPLELIVRGISAVAALAEEINGIAGHPQITTIDIGGGLPVNFLGEEVTPTFREYAQLLAAAVPGLFSGAFRVVTEFGRSLLAKNGFMLARVEYTKVTGGRHIAISHAGAQVAARTVFMPESWPIRVTALDAAGRRKHAPRVEQDIAGPCCFAGDIIAHRRLLPLLEPGDHVLVHDTGAYYFSTPFLYNSLPSITVYGVESRGDGIAFIRLDRDGVPRPPVRVPDAE